MVLIYYVFSFLLYLISIPFLILLSFKKKYKLSIPARFFLYKNPPFKEKRDYFHACSLGETKTLLPLIENKKINLSVITNTAFLEAKKYKNIDLRFLPFEVFLPFWFKPCNKLVVIEAELWYMLFFIAKRRCRKTILLNARISDRSYKRYLKFKWFYKRVFENIDIILAQSEIDKKRLKELGAKNIEVVGNIKTYFKPKITKKYNKLKPLIVVASTHKNEEELILSNLPLDEYQVVVAPRHPERFEEVYKLMKKFGDVKKVEDDLTHNLMLMSKMGELINLYAISDIVILGGSFVDNVGGHNPIEVAYFNKPIISGEYIFNQKVLYNEVENIVICKPNEISKYLKKAKPTYIKNKVDIKKVLSYLE